MTSWLKKASAHWDPNEGGARFGRFEAGLIVVAAIGLTVMQFGGAEQVFLNWFGESLAQAGPSAVDYSYSPLMAARAHPWYDLLGLLHWVAFCLLGYVIIPIFFLKKMGHQIGDYYLGFSGFWQHAGLYALLVSPVLLVVLGASFMSDFQAIYPFYRQAGRSWFDLIAWELLYGVQFFALEFFFRGFLLQGLRKWLGYGAVFIMILPYCMLHFQKTGVESVGSIVAGVVLGTMAMRYRSIWGGVMVHWLIAIEMDVTSLIQKGDLPTSFWP